jgi:hypothetical protein
MREELRGFGERATTDVLDELGPKSRVEELERDQSSEISMWPCSASIDDRTAVGGALHLSGDLLANLKRVQANVRPNRCDEVVRLV